MRLTDKGREWADGMIVLYENGALIEDIAASYGVSVDQVRFMVSLHLKSQEEEP